MHLFIIDFYTYAVAIGARLKYGINANGVPSVIHRWKLFWKCLYIDLCQTFYFIFFNFSFYCVVSNWILLFYAFNANEKKTKFHDTIPYYRAWYICFNRFRFIQSFSKFLFEFAINIRASAHNEIFMDDNRWRRKKSPICLFGYVQIWSQIEICSNNISNKSVFSFNFKQECRKNSKELKKIVRFLDERTKKKNYENQMSLKRKIFFLYMTIYIKR